MGYSKAVQSFWMLLRCWSNGLSGLFVVDAQMKSCDLISHLSSLS